jgi:hypothetical protein
VRKAIALVILTFIFLVKPTFAQTITLPMPTAGTTPSVEPSIINYDLPYPGILPGSPLYVFKNIRDKLKEFTTTDPVRKTEFYLLQADKQLASALLLYKQNQKELADATLLKSQNNLDKSIDSLIESKKLQKNVNDLPIKIKTSSEKQKQEVLMLMENSKNDDAGEFKKSLNRAEQNENRANSFNP